MNRELIIDAITLCYPNLTGRSYITKPNCSACPYSAIHDCRQHLHNDIRALLNDRTRDYEEWANDIGIHTCATCTRASDNRKDHTTMCPIEEHYSLPKDGHCHLWEGFDDKSRS